jgi:electron transfer flavoprotein beta subunit
MNIIVCIKRVPDLAEAELEVRSDGQGVVEDDLAWGINEWDNVAVEAAVALKEEHGGAVTALTVGAAEDDEDVLRRALAMGADEAIQLRDPAFLAADAHGIAAALHAAISGRPFDLVLCGAVSGDLGQGAVGGLLAAALDVPMIALATGLTVADGTATVRHEVEGGLERVVSLDLPALVTVQTGLCEPRYVSIRGIRKVAGADIPVKDAAALGLDAAALAPRVKLVEMFPPPRGEGAEMLEGDEDTMAEALVERLHQRGAIR